jgi:outer membrane receptor protein involved in Fe transport
LFDGSGRPGVGLIDYIGMFIPQAEQSGNNQLAGFDVSFFVPLNESAPARSVRLYVDGAGEDEAGFLPSKWGWLFGLQISDLLKTGRTDLRVEYANNHVPGYPNVFYTHNLYEYSYKGRVIGHHMGTDADDLFVQVSHYLTEDVVLDLTYDRQVQEPSSKPHQTVNQFGLDLTVFVSKDWQLETGYRYDNEETTANDNHIFQIYLIRKF